jgi:hypothetical protein
MRPRWLAKRSFRLLVIVGVISVVAGTAVASLFLFQHTLPGTTLPPPAHVVTSACGGALPAAGYVGASTTNAWAVFSCSGESTPTQSVPAILFDYVGSATAAFTAPTGVADVWLMPNGASLTTGCAQGGSSAFNLTANPTITVTSSNLADTFNYCIDGPPSGAFASFTISWSQ